MIESFGYVQGRPKLNIKYMIVTGSVSCHPLSCTINGAMWTLLCIDSCWYSCLHNDGCQLFLLPVLLFIVKKQYSRIPWFLLFVFLRHTPELCLTVMSQDPVNQQLCLMCILTLWCSSVELSGFAKCFGLYIPLVLVFVCFNMSCWTSPGQNPFLRDPD